MIPFFVPPPSSPIIKPKKPAETLPPEDGMVVDVLPGVLIQCLPDPEDDDESFFKITWPGMAAAAPVVGDFIWAVKPKGTVGRVEARGFQLHPEFGPIIILHLRTVEAE